MTLYRKCDHIDDPPEGSIYVADSYEEPWLTMVPVDLIEAKNQAWEVLSRWRDKPTCDDETLAAMIAKTVFADER